MEDKYKHIIEIAIQIVLFRDSDVYTEDGTFATTCIYQIISLEQAIAEAFELDSDDVSESDLPMIMAKLKQPTKPN